MRFGAVVCSLGLAGCATVQPVDDPFRDESALTERPWLITTPSDEIKVVDTQTIRAVRRTKDASDSASLDGTGEVKVGKWVAIGLGVVAATVITNEVADAS
jgi:hypothetical protein